MATHGEDGDTVRAPIAEVEHEVAKTAFARTAFFGKPPGAVALFQALSLRLKRAGGCGVSSEKWMMAPSGARSTTSCAEEVVTIMEGVSVPIGEIIPARSAASLLLASSSVGAGNVAGCRSSACFEAEHRQLGPIVTAPRNGSPQRRRRA